MSVRTGTSGTSGKLVVGKETVRTYHDAEYVKFREKYGLADDFLTTIDFEKMEAGGGKGGMMMGFTKDELYIVKELNPTDHATMLKIAPEFLDHLMQGSLLARIFAHFEHKGHVYIVMNNWMPPPRYHEAESKFDLKRNYSRYDLKGCADDKTLTKRGESVKAVHKRIFNLHLWLGKLFWSDARKHYHEGKVHAAQVKFPVSKKDHADIVTKVSRDVAFLQKYQLMDYSLVVSYHAAPRDPALLDAVFRGSSDGGSQPYIGLQRTNASVIYVGIIDFLQDWNLKKVVAQCIKVAERNKATIPPRPYGDRFADFVKHKFVPVADDDDNHGPPTPAVDGTVVVPEDDPSTTEVETPNENDDDDATAPAEEVNLEEEEVPKDGAEAS